MAIPTVCAPFTSGENGAKSGGLAGAAGRGSCGSRPLGGAVGVKRHRGSGPLGGAVGPARGPLSCGARRPYRKWRLLRADGRGGGGGDDGGGLRGGWGGPLPLPLPRLPGRRAARGLRGLLLRGARHRHPDVSSASRPEPGARPGLARERADRWAGPGALGDALAGCPRGPRGGRDKPRR